MFNRHYNAAIVFLVIVLLFWSSPLETTYAQLTPSLPQKTLLDRVRIQLSMIALIEPPMIAVIEPLESAQKAISDGFSN